MSLLPSNASSMGHLDVVGNKLGEGFMWIILYFEINDSFVEGDAAIEKRVGWCIHGFCGDGILLCLV